MYTHTHKAKGSLALELLPAFREALEKCVERIVIGRETKSFKRVLFPLGPQSVFFNDFVWK